MKKILLFFLLVPFLFKCSCQKKDKTVYPTYYMDQEIKDYCVFPVGSYWIYQDSVSGSIDSVYLYRQEILIDDSRQFVSFNYESFTQNLSSSYFNDTLYGGGGADSYPYSNLCDYSERYISNYIIRNTTFFSNKDTGSLYEPVNNIKTKYILYNDSLLIKNIWFKKVKVFKNLQQEAPNLPEKIFHAQKVGVIRRELFNGQIWNLIRYHVN